MPSKPPKLRTAKGDRGGGFLDHDPLDRADARRIVSVNRGAHDLVAADERAGLLTVNNHDESPSGQPFVAAAPIVDLTGDPVLTVTVALLGLADELVPLGRG